MNRPTDQHLLRDYAKGHAEPAFAELVRRHVDFVYSAAVRMVCDRHLAEDVTQAVFAALARDASRLCEHPLLSAWLHRTTRNLAANAVRTEVRRRTREQEAIAMDTLRPTPPDAAWEQLAPHLDAALGDLNERDRDVLLLRYFERLSARDMAQRLGTSEEAAQKRVTRAVDRLRLLLDRRGLTVGSGGLATLLATQAVQPIPVGFAATVSTAALTGATLATNATPALAQSLAMTTLQKITLTATVALVVGLGLHQARQGSQPPPPTHAPQSAQTALTDRIQALERERDDARALAAKLAEENRQLNQGREELARLRGDVGKLRSILAERGSEIARLGGESIHGRFRPRSEWSDKGNQDPFATVETMLWASSEGVRSRLEEVTTPQAAAETRWPVFPTEQPPIQTVGAVSLVNSIQNQENTRAVVTAFVREDFAPPPGGEAYSVQKLRGWRLINTGDGWRISRMLFFDLGTD